jgi:hypothetical protein
MVGTRSSLSVCLSMFTSASGHLFSAWCNVTRFGERLCVLRSASLSIAQIFTKKSAFPHSDIGSFANSTVTCKVSHYEVLHRRSKFENSAGRIMMS